ncbi:MAG: MFS transporter [Planctomycetota bacterium]
MKNEAAVLPRLSLMMFLQYAVWGAWLPLASRYMSAPVAAGGLGFDSSQIGWILGLAGSIGAVMAPFVAGQLADRYFSTERFLTTLLVIGGAIQLVLASRTDFTSWLVLSIAYSVVYMPTLSLSNSLAFAHLTDKTVQFPRVRVWGTLGWIAASWTFPMIWLQTGLGFHWMPPFLTGPQVPDATARLADALRFSGMISFGYAAFCLLLPHTPPKRDAVAPLAFARAFRLLARPSFAVLVAVSLPISILHQIYFIQGGPFLSHLGLSDSQIGPAMTIGQFSEILVTAALGGLLARFGFRTVLAVGALAYAARYAIWSSTGLPVEVLVASQALHGVCYACFFTTAYIYVDKIAPADVRHSAQTVFGILILGGGPVIGGWLSGELANRYPSVTDGVPDFSRIWGTLSTVALFTAAFLAVAFRAESKPAPEVRP